MLSGSGGTAGVPAVSVTGVSGSESAGTSRSFIGSQAASSNYTTIAWFGGGTKMIGSIGGSGSAEYAPLEANAQSNGFISVNVNGNRSAQYFRNGIKIGTDAIQSADFENANLFVLANNVAGSPTYYSSNAILQFAYISSGLTEIEMKLLNSYITEFENYVRL